MFGDLDLKPFIGTLNVLGLLSCCFTNPDSGSHIQRTLAHKVRSFFAMALMQTTCGLLFLYWLLFPEQFDFESYNSTGNIYVTLNYVSGSAVISVIYLYFFICQTCLLQTIESVLSYQQTFLQFHCKGWNLRHWFGVYILLAITNFVNNYRVFSKIKVGHVAGPCYQFMNNLIFLLFGIIILTYVSVIKIVECCMQHINDDICRMMSAGKESHGESFDLIELMAKRKKLIDLCERELGERFGPVFLVIVTFMVFSAPSGPFYFISIITSMRFDSIWVLAVGAAGTMYWILPWLVIFVAVMSCAFDDQVNKHKSQNRTFTNFNVDANISQSFGEKH